MFKTRKHAALILSAVLLVSGCTAIQASEGTAAQGPESHVSVTHELGQVKVPKDPKRVVVFDYGLADMMSYLDIEVTALPKASIPSFLSKYKEERYADVGTLKEPDFEKVFALKPDVIFISSRTQAAYEELAKIAPTVYLTVDPADYFASLEKNAALVGAIFGKEDRAMEKVAQLKDKARQIRETAEKKKENGLIILANDGSLSAYGPVSRFGILHHTLGFAPADAGIEDSTHGQSVTFEYILEKDPQNLFVVDRTQVVGGQTDAGKALDNALIRETKAYRSGKIHYLDAEVWYVTAGGFLGTERMLEEVSDLLEK